MLDNDNMLKAVIGKSENTKITVRVERKIGDGQFGNLTIGSDIEIELEGNVTGIEKSYAIALTEAQLETAMNNVFKLKGFMSDEEVQENKKRSLTLINSLKAKADSMSIDVDKHIKI